MTDTILSPNGIEAYSVRAVVVPGLGAVAPVGALTPAEVQALRDDVAAVLGMTSDDLSDVDLTGVNTGMILVRRSGQWVPEYPSVGLDSVGQNYGGSPAFDDITTLSFGTGLAVTNPSSGRAHIQPTFGTSADTLARGNHTHPPTFKVKQSFNKAGAILSGGENMLIDYTATGMIPSVVYDINVIGTLEAVNTNNSGRLTLKAQIGEIPEEAISRGFSGGVWSSVTITGRAMAVTGVSSIRFRFWAEYESGDPTALYTGDLFWDIAPRGGTA